MNIYDPYPDRVEANGRVYQLDLAYDRVLRCIDVEEEPGLTSADKRVIQCAWLLADENDIPESIQEQTELLKAVFDLLPKGDEKHSGEKSIDFHQDAAMIRSAFFRIGVDLTRDKIHFLQFCELLSDLPQDTALMRTVEIRQRPYPKPTKENAEQIAALRKAKERVAIRMSDEERRARFMESLKHN